MGLVSLATSFFLFTHLIATAYQPLMSTKTTNFNFYLSDRRHERRSSSAVGEVMVVGKIFLEEKIPKKAELRRTDQSESSRLNIKMAFSSLIARNCIQLSIMDPDNGFFTTQEGMRTNSN